MNILKIEWDQNRIFGLDILRAFAIFIVVLGHGSHLLPERLQVLNQLIQWDGVSIFFVLSGYLIGGILIKTLSNSKRRGIFNFWVRRWFRTLPNYFLILSILLTLQVMFKETSPKAYWDYFIFSQNIFYPHPDFFGEAWSLSVEEWFYIITPIILFTSAKYFPVKKSVLGTAVAIILLITLIRYYRFLTLDIETLQQWDLLIRKQVITRLDSVMYGLLGAYLSFFHQKIWLKFRISLFFMGIAIFLFFSISKMYHLQEVSGLYFVVFRVSLVSLAALLVLPLLSSIQNGSGIIYKGITYLSLISYSVYLLHFSIVLEWIVPGLVHDVWVENNYLILFLQNITYWGLTITLSILLYKYFEVPTMNLRNLEVFKSKRILSMLRFK